MSEAKATYIDSNGKAQPDRRAHHEVRAVFEQAWALMEPMLTAGPDKPEHSGFALAVKLRDHFPELSQAHLNLLVATAMRIRREGRIIAASRRSR